MRVFSHSLDWVVDYSITQRWKDHPWALASLEMGDADVVERDILRDDEEHPRRGDRGELG